MCRCKGYDYKKVVVTGKSIITTICHDLLLLHFSYNIKKIIIIFPFLTGQYGRHAFTSYHYNMNIINIYVTTVYISKAKHLDSIAVAFALTRLRFSNSEGHDILPAIQAIGPLVVG